MARLTADRSADRMRNVAHVGKSTNKPVKK
jgi:hypothetical protein